MNTDRLLKIIMKNDKPTCPLCEIPMKIYVRPGGWTCKNCGFREKDFEEHDHETPGLGCRVTRGGGLLLG